MEFDSSLDGNGAMKRESFREVAFWSGKRLEIKGQYVVMKLNNVASRGPGEPHGIAILRRG